MESNVIVSKESTPPLRRRWLVAAATLLVVVVTVGTVIITSGSGSDQAATTPLGVVEQFFDHWNDADTEAAMALVDPDFAVGPFGSDTVRGLIDWTSRFDGTQATTCVQTSDTRVSCGWGWQTAATEALDLKPWVDRSFVIADGLITQMSTPNYADLEQRLTTFIEAQDPGGYAAACTPDGTSTIAAAGYARTVQCGEFMAGLEDAFVASLDG